MKEEKKGKPTKITKWEKDGVHQTDKYQNYIYFIDMEDGDKGAFLTKSKDQTEFVIGTEISYLREAFKREGKEDYIKFSLPKPAFVPRSSGGGYQAMSIEDHILREKVKAISISLSYAHDIIKDDVTGEKIKVLAKTFYEFQCMLMDKLIKKGE